MNNSKKTNTTSILSLADLKKFRIPKAQLKMVKGGDDIVIEDVIEQ